MTKYSCKITDFKSYIMDYSRADYATPLYAQKLALNFVDKWRSSVGIVRLRTKGHGVFFIIIMDYMFSGYPT
jgi:hypothetical protein